MARAVASFIKNREDSLVGVQIYHRKLGRLGFFMERLCFRVVLFMYHRCLVDGLVGIGLDLSGSGLVDVDAASLTIRSTQ